MEKIINGTNSVSKLLCVVPTHLFGLPSDIDKCRQLLEPEVLIVEDAVHSVGLLILYYKKIQESSMFRKHTLQDIVDELDAIECFEIPGKKLQV